jgi:uncharacterized protein (TIGR02996 family)
LSGGSPLAAIDANREDLDAYRVYADWLSERGDPWGQVIAIQHALRTLPRFGQTARRDELEREETRLLYEHRRRLWGALADEVFDAGTQTQISDLVEATWQCGFVDTIRIHRAPASALVRLLPALPKLEIMRFVRALDLYTAQWTRDACDGLAVLAWPSIETLTIRGYSDRLDARWVVPAIDAMLALREVSVEHSHSTDGLCRALALHPVGDRLVSLQLFDGQFTAAGIGALSGGNFRKLTKLVVTGDGPTNARALLARTARDLTVDLIDPEA